MSSKARKKKQNRIDSKKELYGMIPLFLIVAVVPLILYIKQVVLNDPGNLYWDGNDTHYDIFSYYKMVWLLVFTVVGIISFFLTRSENPFKIKEKEYIRYYIPMCVFILMALLSAAFSEYKAVAFNGFLDRFEGFYVLAAYIIIMFMAMNGLREERTIKVFFTCLFTSAFIIIFLGSLQLFGIDYFKWDFVTKIITPSSLGIQLNAAFPERTVFSTLYNPNYVGSYVALIIPAAIVFLVYVKKLWQKIGLFLVLILAAISGIGSKSSAGLVGVAVSVLVLLVMFRRKIWNHKVISAVVLVLAIATTVGLNNYTEGALATRLAEMITLEEKSTTRRAGFEDINDITMDNESVQIKTDSGTLQILNKGVIVLLDENDTKLAFTQTATTPEKLEENPDRHNSVISIDNDRFKDIKLYIYDNRGLIRINNGDKRVFEVTVTEAGLINTPNSSYSNRWMAYRDGRTIESIGFEDYERLGSGRGYIWSRSLPLLKDTIILGNGPDTFAINFPQYDYLGKIENLRNGGIFVDKAHNSYLQTALNTGIISLLALLVIYIQYIVSSIKIYIKGEFEGLLPYAGMACFTAVCGYLATAFFNDSVVSVAPVFWALLGAGIGINLMVKRSIP